jgi:hypothetical protein
MTERTITSDVPTCPQCYYNTTDWDEDVTDLLFKDVYTCDECGCTFRLSIVEKVKSTEIKEAPDGNI